MEVNVYPVTGMIWRAFLSYKNINLDTHVDMMYNNDMRVKIDLISYP